MIHLLYFLRDEGGCGYYRQFLPFSTLAQVRPDEFKVADFSPGGSIQQLETGIAKADVIVIPRLGEKEFIVMLKELQKLGKKLIVDFDDDMFHISPLSPHYKDIGTENVEVVIEGIKRLKLWVDGKNMNIAENKVRIENIKDGANMADLVTVTSPILVERYKEHNKNVTDVRNMIDTNLWRKLPFKERDNIRIGWAGGFSHYEDWLEINGVMQRVMDKYKNVTLVLMGSRFNGTLKGIDPNRIEFHGWEHTKAYPYKYSILDIDIGVIPLRDTYFNRGKSNIKWVENAAAEIPCVVSHLSPYMEWITEDNGISIERNDKDAWFEGISYLIDNKEARLKMGKAAREYAVEKFDITRNIGLWADVITGVVNGKQFTGTPSTAG